MVRFSFGFLSLKLKKLNRTQTEKTEPNWFEPVFILKNRTETGWFEPVLVLKKIISVWLFFFYKNRTERKIITPTYSISAIFLEIR
jgi:hypothetical protein